MVGLVLDASVVLAVMLPDEIDAYADKAMEAVTKIGAHAPAHWPLEISQRIADG